MGFAISKYASVRSLAAVDFEVAVGRCILVHGALSSN